MGLDVDDEVPDELELIFSIAVRMALGADDFDQLHRWFVDSARILAPEWVARFGPDEGAWRALAWQMARFVWTHTPDPDLGFRYRKLDKPARNEPCPCGSGRKFKQCCQPLPDLTETLSNFSLLPYVLDCFSRKDLRTLPFGRLDPEELAHVARTWQEKDRLRDAEALLEGFFSHVKVLDRKAEWAFDVLMDLYLELGHPRKRKRLLEQALASKDKSMRAAALHRKCVMLADEGETEAAWKVFTEAQRLDPDNPSLAHLEVVLLIAQGRAQEASERARFWIARLKRTGLDEYQDLIDLLTGFANDPTGTTVSISPQSDPIERLLGLLQAHPESVVRYRLQCQDGDAGPLEPSPQLVGIERQWLAEHAESLHPWEETGWLDWLEAHPEALDSFVVLRDLVSWLDGTSLMEPVIEALKKPLLARGVALLERVIADQNAQGCRLEWGWLENRPALWLVGEMAVRLSDEEPERAAELLEWLVLTLNPNDNQGLRSLLAHLYVRIGTPEQAIALSDRYPDDFADMRYARALALHAAGQPGQALMALADAKRQYPKVLKTLLAKNPKPPPMNTMGITIGGDDEAWMYRLQYRPVWEAAGALEWAATVARSLK